jgi:hypothetical protein
VIATADQNRGGGQPDAGLRRVDVHTGRAKLEQRTLGDRHHLRRFPQLCRHGDGGSFVGRQLHRGQRIRLPVDLVALRGIERRHPPRLQRDAEVAQLVLVALEHPGERLVTGALGIPGHGLADAFGGDERAGGQERDDEVHQALYF